MTIEFEVLFVFCHLCSLRSLLTQSLARANVAGALYKSLNPLVVRKIQSLHMWRTSLWSHGQKYNINTICSCDRHRLWWSAHKSMPYSQITLRNMWNLIVWMNHQIFSSSPKSAEDSDYVASNPEIRQKYGSVSQGTSSDVEAKYLVFHETLSEWFRRCSKCEAVVIKSNYDYSGSLIRVH